ncbi:MAG: NAD(P)/FAD-dependent oxidoreductase, partial [Bacteroidia bacterium]
EEFLSIDLLAEKIKKLPLTIIDIASIDEAISTVGGISLQEVDESFQLKKLPNHYAIGEMLDWDAPTGGYLLQACFSMGAFLGKQLNNLNT